METTLHFAQNADAGDIEGSAEQDDGCGPAGCGKRCFCKLCTWPGREWPTVVFHQEKHLKKRGYKKWLTQHGNLSIIL